MNQQEKSERIQQLYDRIGFLEDSKIMSNRFKVSQMHKEIRELNKTN